MTTILFILNDLWGEMIGETDTDMYPGVLWLEENHIQKAKYWQKLSGLDLVIALFKIREEHISNFSNMDH